MAEVNAADTAIDVGGGPVPEAQGDGVNPAPVGVVVAPPPGAAAHNGDAPQGGPNAGPANQPADGDPNLAAVLQGLATGQQLINERLSHLEHSHPVPQQPQPQQMQQGGGQSAGGAPTGLQPQPVGIGAGGVPPLQAPLDPTQLATVTAAVKANAKQAADLWRSTGGQRYFLARGGFHVPEETSSSMLRLTLKHVDGVTDAMVQQLGVLDGIDVQVFCPPTLPGEPHVPMPAQVHFQTFVAAYDAVLRYGMENAPPMCKNRVAGQTLALKALEGDIQTYLLRHFGSLAPHGPQMRELLVPAMNIGIDEAMEEIAREALGVWRASPQLPPAWDSVPTMQAPKFEQLRALVKEGSPSSLMERLVKPPRKTAATTGAGAAKRKTPPGASGGKGATTKGRGGGGGGGGGDAFSFMTRLHQWKPPRSVCESTWRGERCVMEVCPYAHDQVSPDAPAYAAAKAAGTLTPSSAPPPPQQQQQQTGGGAGGPRLTSVARYSKNYGGGGSGGTHPGAGAGRGRGGN